MTQDLSRLIAQQAPARGDDSARTARLSGKLALRPSHERILEAFATFGPMIPDELAERIGRSALYVRPRCSELRAMGLLRATGESRRNATSGLSAVVLTVATAP